MKVRVVNKVNLKEMIEDYWRISRPHLDEIPPFEKIISMGLPVNGLIQYNIHIEGPIFLRDLLYSVRPVQAWAQSSRATPINKDVTSLDVETCTLLSLKDVADLGHQLDMVFKRLSDGEKQEYVKTSLPLMTKTSFIVGFDLRTLVNVLYTIECHNKKFFDIFGKEVLKACKLTKLYKDGVLPRSDISQDLILSPAEKEFFEDKKSHHKLGDITNLSATVTCNLMAQVVRKNDAIIKNGLWDLFINDPKKVYTSNCNMLVPVSMYIKDSSLKKMVSTRSCFFARMDKTGPDSWDSLIGGYINSMLPKEFMAQLPCGGHLPCSIEGDMIPRVDGREPNPPCPILIEDSSVIADRVNEFGSNSSIMKMWMKVREYIKDNPMNEYQNIYYNFLNSNK